MKPIDCHAGANGGPCLTCEAFMAGVGVGRRMAEPPVIPDDDLDSEFADFDREVSRRMRERREQ